MGVELGFGLAGVIILVGVVSGLLSKRMGIPDIPILILLGIMIGPLSGLVVAGTLVQIAPTFAALAITIILFEGGMHMNIRRLASQAGRAVLLAVTGFLLSLFLVGWVASVLLGWSLPMGLILGSTVGGSSSVAVVALLKRVGATEKVAALLRLESALTDVLVVVITMSLIQVIVGSTETSMLSVIPSIFQSFSTGAVIGGLVGFAWLRMLDRLSGEPYCDIATIGVLLGTYALTNFLNGNGTISALVFGLVLGNGSEILRQFNLRTTAETHNIMERFHEQISFTLRTFFFVYLGLMFSPTPEALLQGGIITALLFGARYVAVIASSSGNVIMKMDSSVMTILFPRGLAAAVLAQNVLQSGVAIAGQFVDVVISVIILSVLTSSAMIGASKYTPTINLGVPSITLDFLRVRGNRPARNRRSYPDWFKKRLREALLADRPGEPDAMVVENFTAGSFVPLLSISRGEEMAVYEQVLSLDDLKRLPQCIESCQTGGFRGGLNFVFDTAMTYKWLPRLLTVQEYCERSTKRLGFEVNLQTFDVRSRKIVPIGEMTGDTGRRRESRSQRVLESVKSMVVGRVHHPDRGGEVSARAQR